jgi:putative membrane protein
MTADRDGDAIGGGRLKLAAALLFVAGLGICVALLAWLGLESVAEVMSTAGARLIWLGPYYALPVLFATLSWRVLFAPGGSPPFRQLFVATWVGLAINWLLPVAQIGGEFVKFRWLRQRGTPGDQAGATVIIGKMIQAFSQVLYTLTGLSLLLLVFDERGLAPMVLGGCAIAILALLLFYRMQRAGFFGGLAAMGRRLSHRLARFEVNGGAAAMDAAIDEGYRQWRRVLLSLAWRMAFRFVLAGEVWLALAFMGHPISLIEAIILESLIEAVRGAAFAVPAGLGVQEAGIVLLGAAMGLSPEVALALALAKRFRELLVGLPGLLTWQIAEGRILAGRLAVVRAERRRDDGVG